MSYLLIGDLHLTDRPRDAYRFDIFKWIKQQQEKYKVTTTFLLGDITNEKDRHSATLVNNLIDNLKGLKPPVFICKGNHDYTSPDNPFFGFLNWLDGIIFVSNPGVYFCGDLKVAILPHCREEKLVQMNCEAFADEGKIDLLLCHNTFQGAIAETGAPLTGFSATPIEALKPRLGCYAGDVHRPQKAGPVTYVGAPYHIRFGDDFDPRCILLDDNDKAIDLYFEAPRKWKVTVTGAYDILKNKNLIKGDHIKVTIELAREEAVEWQTYKQQVLDACAEIGLEVFGVDLKVLGNSRHSNTSVTVANQPVNIVEAFCQSENAPSQVREAGLACLNSTAST